MVKVFAFRRMGLRLECDCMWVVMVGSSGAPNRAPTDSMKALFSLFILLLSLSFISHPGGQRLPPSFSMLQPAGLVELSKGPTLLGSLVSLSLGSQKSP